MIDEVTFLNLSTRQILKLDKNSSSFFLEVVSWGQVEASHSTVKGQGQTGNTRVGTSLGTRVVYCVGWIVGDEQQRRKQRNFLSSFFNPNDEFEMLVENDYKLTFSIANSIKYSTVRQENNNVFFKFSIEGTANDPMWKNTDEQKVIGASTTPLFRFPLIIPEDEGVVFGVRTPSSIVTINNNGDIVTGFRILINAYGTVVNPAIYNAVTQEYIKIEKTLSAGENLEINTVINQRKAVGQNGSNNDWSNYYIYRDIDSTWLSLNVGENLFKYDADEGVDLMDVTFYHYDNLFEPEKLIEEY